MALSVTINGVNEVAHLVDKSLVITRTMGDRPGRTTFTMFNFFAQVQDTLVIADGATTYFSGSIYSIHLKESHAGDYFVSVTGLDAGTVPSYRAAPFSFSDLGAEATYQRLMTELNPHCWWRLGEASGITAADEEGVQDGTYISGPTLGATSPFTTITDTAVTFDGSTEYVTVGAANLRGQNDLMIAAWAKSSSTSGINQMIYAERSTTSAALIRFYLDPNGRPVFQWRNDAGTLDTIGAASGDWTDGTWHHFMAVKETDLVSIYVDGKLVRALYMTGTNTQTSTMTANIGRDPHTTDQYFQGSLDEVMIFRTSSDATVAESLYQSRNIKTYASFEWSSVWDGSVNPPVDTYTVTTYESGLLAGDRTAISATNSYLNLQAVDIQELRLTWKNATTILYTATCGNAPLHLASAFP